MSRALVATRVVREQRAPGDVPLYRHPEWEERFPWIIQGVTGRGDADAPFDLGLSGGQPVGAVLGRWRALREATGMPIAVHARQVHGATVLVHHTAGPSGLVIADDADAHVTRAEGMLLTVSVADCVPVYLVAPRARAVALLHAGWRGVAAGIVERGIEVLLDAGEATADELFLHLGPAICGACYEVGPEVHEALGLDRPAGNRTVDLRFIAAARAVARGVSPERITASGYCTRCADSPFFSHRAGCAERQMGVIGIRTGSAGL